MSYITTYTGLHFDPVSPEVSLIRSEDIAHALSLICRANGHFQHFYSVAQHSIACAEEARKRELSKRVQLACLLHDASEAYLSDVTRPVKGMLTAYLEIEDRLQTMIWEKYLGEPLSEKEKRLVFEIDDDMLSYEFFNIMPEEINERHTKIISKPDCTFREMKAVEKKFLDLLGKLTKN